MKERREIGISRNPWAEARVDEQSPVLLHRKSIAPPIVDLRLREVHLGVGLLEFLQEVVLFLLIRRGETHSLLPLVMHHLLDGLPSLPVEVAEFGVFRNDLPRVNLRVAPSRWSTTSWRPASP